MPCSASAKARNCPYSSSSTNTAICRTRPAPTQPAKKRSNTQKPTPSSLIPSLTAWLPIFLSALPSPFVPQKCLIMKKMPFFGCKLYYKHLTATPAYENPEENPDRPACSFRTVYYRFILYACKSTRATLRHHHCAQCAHL